MIALFRGLLLPALALTGVWALCIAVIRGGDYDDTLRQQLYETPCAPPDDAPCFFGLQPGISTDADANRFLLRSPAVRDHYPNMGGLPNLTGEIEWEWRSPPAYIVPETGWIGMVNGRISYVQLRLDISLGELALAVGQMPQASIGFSGGAFVNASFFNGALNIFADIDCPPTPAALWSARPLLVRRAESVRQSDRRPPEPSPSIWEACS